MFLVYYHVSRQNAFNGDQATFCSFTVMNFHTINNHRGYMHAPRTQIFWEHQKVRIYKMSVFKYFKVGGK